MPAETQIPPSLDLQPQSYRIALVTGGFDPLHRGHLEYFRAASENGKYPLHVGLNSDAWLTRKKGRPFLDYQDRFELIKALDIVSDVWSFDDSDDSAIAFIQNMRIRFPDATLYFCNGGDRNQFNIPEYNAFEWDDGVLFSFGVGGTGKINASSRLTDRWLASATISDLVRAVINTDKIS